MRGASRLLPAVAGQHCQLQQQGKQVFAKALVGQEMWDDTGCWLDEVPMRPGVSYVLANGSKLAFGEHALPWCICTRHVRPERGAPLAASCASIIRANCTKGW
jgi:hypothetical protein